MISKIFFTEKYYMIYSMYSVYQSNLIYCINLEHRKDRKKHTQSEFKKIGIIPENVIYPHLIKHPRGGLYGCYESHMKVWQDFYDNHPEQPYCLVFEDDFVAQPQAKETIEKAQEFLIQNYKQIDLLNLHNLYVPVDNPINNEDFNNGYGFMTHAYFITRHYITKILQKNHNKLPPANGINIDIVTNIDKSSILYSEKIFYTRQLCFTQLVDKSDNYNNKLDELFRQDVNKICELNINVYKFTKKIGLLNDNGIKNVMMFIHNILF